MIRQLVCRECAAKVAGPLHPEDLAQGFQRRVNYVTGRTPPGHGITLNGEFFPLDNLCCDHCNQNITGTICVAITDWRPDRENARIWETEFGQVVPEETVKLADKLSGEAPKAPDSARR